MPDFAIKAALGWLRDYVRQEHTEDRGPAGRRLCALRAGAGARRAILPALRYFNDTQLANLPTQLAMAQLGAALAQAGDVVAGQRGLRRRARRRRRRRPAGLRYVDYGSELRDSAAVLAFAAGNPGMQPRLTEVMDRVAELFARANRTSTQEQAWLLMAAEAAARESGGTMTVATGGAAPQTRRQAALFAPRTRHRRRAGHDRQSRRDPGMANRVDHRRSEGRSAGREQRLHRVPRRVSAATARRPICRRCGRASCSSWSSSGSRADPARAARTLVVDLLPAGFEIETRDPGGRQIAGGLYLAQELDRHRLYRGARRPLRQRARPDATGVKDFTLAYVVRAVTPGEFTYPALVVEDMYEPETAGRTAIGRLSVVAEVRV